jgi:hypothetical protein
MDNEMSPGIEWEYRCEREGWAIFEREDSNGESELLMVPVSEFNHLAPLAEWADLIYEEGLSIPSNFL